MAYKTRIPLRGHATKILRDYTRGPLALDAKASSGLPVVYQSLDPKIVTVDKNGNLLTVGIGTTTVIVRQPGNEYFPAASPIEREVQVNRIPLTITMDDAKMEAGDMLPDIVLKYDGLQFKGKEPLFETSYCILLPDGNSWHYNMLPLTPDTYKVEPLAKGPVALDGYLVTRKEGKLIVTPPQKAKAVTFHIKDGKNNPLKDVTLRYGNVSGIINDGYAVPLLPGNYTISLAKECYTTFVGNAECSRCGCQVD